MLEEHARFCSNMLQKTDKGLAVVPATSPENCFLDQGEAVPVALYTENTLAIIRNLFRDYLEACEVLKKEGALSGTIREQLPAIVLTQLGSDGRILEWNEEFTEVEVEHRHLSHLYEFHPGRGITKETPELLEGVKKSLLVRGDEGTGWSLAWKILMWARMEDGAHAAKQVAQMLQVRDPFAEMSVQGGGVYPNLFCAHPPFQIDGILDYCGNRRDAAAKPRRRTRDPSGGITEVETRLCTGADRQGCDCGRYRVEGRLCNLLADEQNRPGSPGACENAGEQNSIFESRK